MPLIVVPTPIGNLEDVTLRALRALKEADIIACEDTRRTRILCQKYAIATPLLSCHEHNERSRAKTLLHRLREGQTVALVSDAGTPGISDPGAILLKEVLEEGLPLEVLPGATAFVPALLYSGLPSESFLFMGFLGPKRGLRRKALEKIRSFEGTLIFYVSPHKAQAHLEDMAAVLGDRPASLVREISKVHEETLKSTLEGLYQRASEEPFRGELVLVVGGAEKEFPELRELEERIEALLNQGYSPKEVAVHMAEVYNVSKNQVKEMLFSRGKHIKEEKE